MGAVVSGLPTPSQEPSTLTQQNMGFLSCVPVAHRSGTTAPSASAALATARSFDVRMARMRNALADKATLKRAWT